MITKFSIEYFKTVESVELELGSVNVLIGANGSGKSNVLEALAVLAAAASGRVDTESLGRRGCRPTGYNRPLFSGIAPDAETAASAAGDDTSYCVSLSSPGIGRVAGWEFRREVWKQGQEAIVNRELANGTSKGDPQVGLAALKMAEMPVTDKAALFLKALANYSIYAPDTLVLRGSAQDPQVREPVGLSGGRLADAVAELLKQPDGRQKLGNQFGMGMEWFGGFGIAQLTSPQIEPAPRGIAFLDRYLRTDNNHHYFLGPSDVNEGALYLLFVAVLCLHPNAPKFFALDNADHGLNPLLAKNLMKRMCRWLLESNDQRQVLMTTQNPLVLDALDLGDDRIRLFTVDRDNKGRTEVRRFLVTDQHREMAAKGWTLSRMWVNGLIGGVPNV